MQSAVTCSLCVTELGILLVAVSCPQAQGGKLRVNPGKSFIIQQGHVGFFIAQGPTEVCRQVTLHHDSDYQLINIQHTIFRTQPIVVPNQKLMVKCSNSVFIANRISK